MQYQFRNAIEDCFKPEADKRAIKINNREIGNDKTDIVFSYSNKRNLCDFSYSLSTIIKELHPDIKLIKNISGEVMQDCIDYFKNERNCNRATIGTYISYIKKLQDICNKTYMIKVNWKGCRNTADKINYKKYRDIPMSPGDYKKIIEYAEKNSTSKAVLGIKLAKMFALRASEVVKLKAKDFSFEKSDKFKYGYVKIFESKGKHTRTLPIHKENLEFLKNITKFKAPNDRLVPIKQDTLTKQLANFEAAVGVRDKYRQAKTAIHCIRKLAAQELLQKYDKIYSNHDQALMAVSRYLGHHRKCILKVYVGPSLYYGKTNSGHR